MAPQDHPQPIFYYDLASPVCYLAAEAIMAALPVVPEWEPVLATALGTPPWIPDWDRLTELAAELELQPLRPPLNWPPDAVLATLAATYAKRAGRAVAFSLAAFRQQFAGGQDLGQESTVLIAGAACEVHPAALLKGIGLRSTAEALARANQRAGAARVSSLPAIEVNGNVYEGEACIERAGGALGVAP